MKSRILILMFMGLLLAGCSKLPQASNGMSFRAQLCELVQLKDEGLISEEEYKHSRRSLLHRMLH